MSRSFIVEPSISIHITFKELIRNISELKDFEKYVNWEEVQIGRRVNENVTYITSHNNGLSINEGYAFFFINEQNIFVTFYKRNYRSEHDFYYIESRALTGCARDLFVAAASAIAHITKGTVSSADGAWDGDTEFCGKELWNEYLSSQREKDIAEYS